MFRPLPFTRLVAVARAAMSLGYLYRVITSHVYCLHRQVGSFSRKQLYTNHSLSLYSISLRLSLPRFAFFLVSLFSLANISLSLPLSLPCYALYQKSMMKSVTLAVLIALGSCWAANARYISIPLQTSHFLSKAPSSVSLFFL